MEGVWIFSEQHIFIVTQLKQYNMVSFPYALEDAYRALHIYITVHDYVDCSYFKLTMHICFTALTQAVAFLPKTVCNIKEVEFARAVKLNKTSIDLIMFQVPRVKASILYYYYYMSSSVSSQDKPNPAL